MRNGLLASLSAIAVFGIGMLLATSKPSEWLPDVGELVPEEEPILVVLVGSERNVQGVRAAIPSDRVLAETPDAFALHEGRIIASNAEAASHPLSLAGWIDREIELIAVPMGRGREWERQRNGEAGDGQEPDPEKAARIAALVKKPTLNAMEAMVLLQHMDQTGQF